MRNAAGSAATEPEGLDILAADIGGTNARLLLARLEQERIVPIARRNHAGAEFHDAADLIRHFMAEHAGRSRPCAAVLALAGPITQGPSGQQARLTNLPWYLDSAELAGVLKIPQVALLNDFVAIAHGLDELQADKLHTLQEADARPEGLRLLLGAGTGLGACLVAPGNPHPIFPTEAGHAGFAPANPLQARLLDWVMAREGRCSREHLLSGAGLRRMAQFLLDEGVRAGPVLRAAMDGPDPAPSLVQFALEGSDPLAGAAVGLFLDVYGSQTGDLALSCLPHGGIYIAGGIAPRLLPLIETGGFIRAFLNKPPMEALLGQMRVQLILDADAGLLGAARHAARLVQTD